MKLVDDILEATTEPEICPAPEPKAPFDWVRRRNVYQLAKLARRGRRRFNGALKQIEKSKTQARVEFYSLVAQNFSHLRQAVAEEYARRIFGGRTA